MKAYIQKLLSAIGAILLLNFAIAGTLPDDLENAFKTGNSNALSQYFSPSIGLSIPNSDAIFSKNQAKQILIDFFKKYMPTSFVEKHSGEKSDSKFIIGSLQTNNGKFRVSILFRKDGDSIKIHQLRIEKDNGF